MLTYWGLGFYFLFAAIHTGTYAFSKSGRSLIDTFPRPLQAAHSAYYTSITTLPFIVTVVYWGILFDGHWFPTQFDAWTNVSEHAMNSGFALFEIIVPRTPTPPPVHMLWLILILALYLSLAYVTKATRGFYTYGFLNPEKNHGKVAAYVFGIAVAAIVVYGIVWCLIRLRIFLTEGRGGAKGEVDSQHQLEAAPGTAHSADPETAVKTERSNN